MNKLFKSFSKSSKQQYKDYNFEEWQALSSEVKGDIRNSWDSYHPEIGKSTRDAILDGFKLTYSELSEKSLALGYDYFGWMVGCIYIIVPDSSIKVPKEFASIYVNKGYVHKRLDKENILVNWRYGGTKYEYKLPTK